MQMHLWRESLSEALAELTVSKALKTKQVRAYKHSFKEPRTQCTSRLKCELWKVVLTLQK